MSERAIRALRRKFILMSMGTLVATMLLIAGLLYAGNIVINRQVVRSTLGYIIDNNGDLISWNNSKEARKEKFNSSNYIRFLEEIFTTNSGYQSPEFAFSTRYFAVIYNTSGTVSEIKTNHITAVSEDEATVYGNKALNKFFHFGRIDNYYYQVQKNSDGSAIVVYLDSSNVVRSNERLLYLGLMLIGLGMVVAFFLVRLLSFKVIQKELKNAELQKQFMTNASHELKTPLAVIRANTEMAEMLNGEDEWTQSTMRQVERMNGLIKNLVMITRADENNKDISAENVDASICIRETVENFQSLAQSNDKTLHASINDKVHIRAEEAQIRQLCSLLVDNAIKYCDDGGEINVSLAQKGKGIILSVSNSYAEGENVDYTKFFERFYRKDESHNVDRGGYGIGLSIAESLVKKYRGTINASWKKGIITFTCQLKPIVL